MKGANPAYPKQAREAFIAAVFEEGVPYTRAAKLLKSGELREELPPYPRLAISTARGWWLKHLRDQSDAAPAPDLEAWQGIANEALKALAREVEKLKRDSRKGKPIEAERLRKTIVTIREAKSLAATPNPDIPSDVGEMDGRSSAPSLLERLAAQDHPEQPSAAASPIHTDRAPGERDAKQPMVAPSQQADERESGPEMAGPAIARDQAPKQPVVA